MSILPEDKLYKEMDKLFNQYELQESTREVTYDLDDIAPISDDTRVLMFRDMMNPINEYAAAKNNVELPTIPAEVAASIELGKSLGLSMYKTVVVALVANNPTADFIAHDNNNLFAKAWLNGYKEEDNGEA